MEAFFGPIGLRLDMGDEVYFNNGGHNNLRLRLGRPSAFDDGVRGDGCELAVSPVSAFLVRQNAENFPKSFVSTGRKRWFSRFEVFAPLSVSYNALDIRAMVRLSVAMKLH